MKSHLMSLTLFGLLCWCIIYACTTDPDPQPNSPEGQCACFLPLCVGNTWVYTTMAGEGTTSVTRVEKVNNVDYVVVKQTNPFGSNESWQRCDNNTVYLLEDKDSSEAILLRYPLAVGETFVSEHRTVLVESDNHTVTVPAGEYESCVVYKILSTNEVNSPAVVRIFFKPDIGIVKIDSYGPNEEVILSQQLKTVTLK